MTNPSPTEEVEQINLVTWCRWQSKSHPDLELLYSVPNGQKRSRVIAAKLKAAGVLAGVTDLVLPSARGGYFGLYLELKRQSGGSLSEKQKWFRDRIIEQGYYWRECKGFRAAEPVLLEYLGWPRTEQQALKLSVVA